MNAPQSIFLSTPEDHGLLRFLTCGSVDDGKSTLIGRLLYDSQAILADTLSAITRTSERRGLSAADLSLLTDGLQAEREQGITIDVAYRYFSSGRRKYIIADAPGHAQYTRNMVTAASTADLAVILVDARRGIVEQTRRHAAIASLLGIPHLLVAINKMDLVGFDAAVFTRICEDYRAFAHKINGGDVRFLPLSALNGDMVVTRGTHMPWYDGPTLFDVLETVTTAHSCHDERFRFPVQYVCRPQQSDNPQLHDYRGYMGRVESGSVRVGDAVMIQPGEQKSRVQRIEIGGVAQEMACADASVCLLLADDIDIARGAMICAEDACAAPALNAINADLCWLSETPMEPQRRYLLRHTTREVKAKLDAIAYRLNIQTLAHEAAQTMVMNDIARVRLRLAQPIFADTYAQNRGTGAFILIDEASNNTVAAGMIV